jgi:CspA family cold shock protein
VRDHLTSALYTARCARSAIEFYAACQEFNEVSQGTIKKLTDKGFGFIKGDSGEIFFHSSSVVNASYESLQEGQSVEYTEGKGPKGPRAENVKVLG